MLNDMLKRMEKKERLRLTQDYVPLREALEQINNSIAEQIRDDLWKHRDMKHFIDNYVATGYIHMKPEYETMTDEHGYFKGQGLKTPAKDIIERIRELITAAGYNK